MAGEVNSEAMLPVVTGGSSITNVRPVFSYDSRYLLCSCGTVIRVLSVASGECVQQLQGHRKPITGLLTNPQNPLQILSCGLDQTIIKWDVADGVLLKRYQTDRPILTLYPLSSTESCLILLAVRPGPKGVHQLVKFELPRHPAGPLRAQLVIGDVPRDSNKIAVGCDGKYVAYGDGCTLHVDLLKKDGHRWYRLPKVQAAKGGAHAQQGADSISCVACHPTQNCIVTGLNSGRILYWWGFESKDSRVTNSEYHWHSLPVRDLSYSTEGSLLLSGGYECVLAVWQHNTSQKRLLPRMGSPISLIATSRNSTLYAICHADNSIQVVASNLELVQHYQGLTCSFLANQRANPVPTGLLQDPRSGALVLNGRPGHLQFYALETQKQLYNLDIVCQNYTSPDTLNQPTAVTEVERAAIDCTGHWLATVEHWQDGVNTPEIRLKFWSYDTETQQYILNTKVDKPHSQRVCSLKFCSRPAADADTVLAVTTSTDKNFKLWALNDDTDIYRANVCWKCESVGFYRKQPAGPADFSADGSVLGVGFGGTLTLWDPETNALQSTLSTGVGDASHIREVLFGRGSYWHVVLTTTANRLIAWNLLTYAVEWTIDLAVSVLTSDPLSGYIAAFTRDNTVSIFSPPCSKPIFTMKDISSMPVISALFVPHPTAESSTFCWQRQAQLYYMNEDQELFTLTTEEEGTQGTSVQLQSVAHDVPQTRFSQLMLHGRHRQTTDAVNTAPRASTLLQQILSTPCHVLPPVSSLCQPFLQSLVGRPQKSERATRKQHSSVGGSDCDDSNDDDDDDEAKMESKDSDSESDVEADTACAANASDGAEDGKNSENVTASSGTSPAGDRTVSYKRLASERFAWLR